MKPVFKGKWMSAGTSKNGETSIGYACCYPQDMDLAAAFCSPFMIGLSDDRFGPYLMEEVGTEESRSLMKDVIRKSLENGEDGIYKDVCKQMKDEGKEVPSFTKYVFNLFDALFQVYQYTPAENERIAKMTEIKDDKDALLKYLCEVIVDNDDEILYSYWIDSAKEQGLQNPGYEYFADLLEGTSFDKDKVMQSLLKEEDRWIVETYAPAANNKILNEFMMNSTCPLLLYYVHDDPWTTAKPPKLGPNAKLIMNPIGKHNSALNDPSLCPPAVKQEVMDYVQQYIY